MEKENTSAGTSRIQAPQHIVTSSLTTWLHDIKNDDIDVDAGLAADFDGSLSGLGVELGTSTYNMSEALLALPVFKQEVVSDTGSPGNPGQPTSFKSYSELIEQGIIEVEPHEAAPGPAGSNPGTPQPQGTPTHTATSSSQVAASLSRSFAELLTTGYQYILIAATSPATKLNEETLTYLNQGQSYEVKLKMFGDVGDNKQIRTVIRVLFHERRLQYMEKEQIDFWKQTRPGERIIDIDVPLSYGIRDIKTDAQRLNSLEFRWDTTKLAGAFIKVNCISTEFTPKKHGGEKGVPFRVQVESYLEDGNEETCVHCASCQVKIFKPKGADRKHKTDREKMEKRSDSEKEKFQPSYDCTVLTEVPLDQVYGYLEQVRQQEKRALQELKSDGKKPHKHTANSAQSSSTTAAHAHHAHHHAHPPPTSTAPAQCRGNFHSVTETSSSSEIPSPQPVPTDVTTASHRDVVPLSPNANAAAVAKWLQVNRFENYVKVFQNFSGVDLLRLARDDLIQICGLADGIRLNNALQSKSVRPKLTIYICQLSAASAMRRNSTLSDLEKTLQNTHVSNGGGTSPGQVSPGSSAPGPGYTGETSFAGLFSNTGGGGGTGAGGGGVKAEAPSGTRNTTSRSSGTGTGALSRSPPTHPGPTGEHGTKASHGGSGDNRGSSSKYVPMAKSKRQHIDEDEGSCDAPFSSAKKQRTRNLELPRKDVFHAIYLETLTRREVTEKISGLFSVQPAQITEAYMQQRSSSFLVMLTDDVVQNMSDEAQYSIEGQQISDSQPDKYRLVLRVLEK